MFPCLNFVCCCDDEIFQISLKNFIKLSGVLYSHGLNDCDTNFNALYKILSEAKSRRLE